MDVFRKSYFLHRASPEAGVLWRSCFDFYTSFALVYSSPGKSSSHDGVSTKQSASRRWPSETDPVCVKAEPLFLLHEDEYPRYASFALTCSLPEGQVCERSHNGVCVRSNVLREDGRQRFL